MPEHINLPDDWVRQIQDVCRAGPAPKEVAQWICGLIESWESPLLETKRHPNETFLKWMGAEIESAPVTEGVASDLIDLYVECRDVHGQGHEQAKAEALQTLVEAGDSAAEQAREETQWCVFVGGEDANDCAALEVRDDEADAYEHAQWFRTDQGCGVAFRTVRVGRWITAMFDGHGSASAASVRNTVGGAPDCTTCGKPFAWHMLQAARIIPVGHEYTMSEQTGKEVRYVEVLPAVDEPGGES